MMITDSAIVSWTRLQEWANEGGRYWMNARDSFLLGTKGKDTSSDLVHITRANGCLTSQGTVTRRHRELPRPSARAAPDGGVTTLA
ncbi:hypothetical protein Q1695_001409 [Nippostrongylus brasiliensis]|nr:hypothetical protein Q1695_001409 [Nippostrongylus brasiliensis]